MAKFAPYYPTTPLGHYRARLTELGHLAQLLDRDPHNPLKVIAEFFKLDKWDQEIVVEAYQNGRTEP